MMTVSRKRGVHVCLDVDCGSTVPLTQAGTVGAAVPCGRGEDARALLEAADAARTGRPTFVLLEGEAGHGKSTLVRFLYESFAAKEHDPEDYWPDTLPDFDKLYAADAKARWAKKDPPFLWLVGHCTGETQSNDPLAAWRQMLVQVDAHILKDGRRAKELGKVLAEAGLELAIDAIPFGGALKTVAELGYKLAKAARGRGGSVIECDQAQVEGVRRGIANVLNAVSATSTDRLNTTGLLTIVVLEDLHWATRESLELLLQLLRSDRGPRKLLVVGTLRPVDARTHTAGLEDVLQRIGRYAPDEYAFRRIAVGALPPAATALVVRERHPAASHELVTWVSSVTAGNPLFIVEFCRLLVETGEIDTDGSLRPGVSVELLAERARTGAIPARVKDVIAARFDRLERSQRRLLEFASVAGRVFHQAYLRRALTRAGDSPTAERLLLELSDLERTHELVVEAIRQPGDFGFEFAHVLFQTAAGDGLTTALRTSCLEALAETLWEVLLRHEEDGEGEEVAGKQLDLIIRLADVIDASGLADRENLWARRRARLGLLRTQRTEGLVAVAERLAWAEDCCHRYRHLELSDDAMFDFFLEALEVLSDLLVASHQNPSAIEVDREAIAVAERWRSLTPSTESLVRRSAIAIRLAKHLHDEEQSKQGIAILKDDLKRLAEALGPVAGPAERDQLLIEKALILSQLGQMEHDVDPDKNQTKQWECFVEALAVVRGLASPDPERQLSLLYGMAGIFAVAIETSDDGGFAAGDDELERLQQATDEAAALVERVVDVPARRFWQGCVRAQRIALLRGRNDAGLVAALKEEVRLSRAERDELARSGATSAVLAEEDDDVFRALCALAKELLELEAEFAEVDALLGEASVFAHMRAEHCIDPEEDDLIEVRSLQARLGVAQDRPIDVRAHVENGVALARRKVSRLGPSWWTQTDLEQALFDGASRLLEIGDAGAAAALCIEVGPLRRAILDSNRQCGTNTEDWAKLIETAGALGGNNRGLCAFWWELRGQAAVAAAITLGIDPNFVQHELADALVALARAAPDIGIDDDVVASTVDDAVAAARLQVDGASRDPGFMLVESVCMLIADGKFTARFPATTIDRWLGAGVALAHDAWTHGDSLALPYWCHAEIRQAERAPVFDVPARVEAFSVKAQDDGYQTAFADFHLLRALARLKARAGRVPTLADDARFVGEVKRAIDLAEDYGWEPCDGTLGTHETLRRLLAEMLAIVDRRVAKGGRAKPMQEALRLLSASFWLAANQLELGAADFDDEDTLIVTEPLVERLGAELGLPSMGRIYSLVKGVEE